MEGVDLALAVLPGWVGPSTVVAPVALGLLAGWGCGALIVRIGGWGRRRLRPDSHWSERAAALWPARVGLGLVAVILPVLTALVGTFLAGPLSPLPVGARMALASGASFVGALLAARPLRGWLGLPRVPLGDAARAGLVSSVVRWASLFSFVALALFLPVEPVGIWVGASVLLLLLPVVTLAGLPLELLRWLGLVDPTDERLRRLAASAAGEGEVPRLYVAPGELPNAFAFPLGNRVMVTRPTLALLDDDELTAVLAHEIAHLREPRRVALGRMASSWALIPILWVRPAWSLGAGAPGILLVLLAGTVLISLAVRRLARRMEVRADAHAISHDADAGAYARALEKIYRGGMIPAVLDRRATHPALYDRLVAAGAPPTWPRPAPPSTRGTLLALLATLYVGVGGLFTLVTFTHLLGVSPPVAIARIALGAGNAWDLAALSDAALAEDATPAGQDVPRALTLLAAAAAIEPEEVRWSSRLAGLYAASGDCAGAVRALRSASAALAARTADEATGDPGDGEGPSDGEYEEATKAVSECLGAPGWGGDQGAPGVPPG